MSITCGHTAWLGSGPIGKCGGESGQKGARVIPSSNSGGGAQAERRTQHSQGQAQLATVVGHQARGVQAC